MELANSKAFSGVCYFLASVFVIKGILTLWSFRLLPGSITSLTRQRSIHICAILVAICRSVFFFMVPSWEGIMFYIRMSPSPDTTSILLYVLEDIPSLIFIILFSLQLLTWGVSYYTAISAVHVYHNKMRPTVRNSIWLLIVLQLIIWISYSFTVGPKTKYQLDPDIWSLSAAVLHSVAFLVGAIVMLIYGYRVQKNISQVPVALEVRNRQLRRIALVTSVCTITFLIRTIGIVVASVMAYVDIGQFTDNSSFFALCFVLVFFLTTEILPLGVLLHFQGEFRRVRFQHNRLDIIPQFSKDFFVNLQKRAATATFTASSRHRVVFANEEESRLSRLIKTLFRRKPRNDTSDPEQQPLVTSALAYNNWQTFKHVPHPPASAPDTGTAFIPTTASSSVPSSILAHPHTASSAQTVLSVSPHLVQPIQPDDHSQAAQDSDTTGPDRDAEAPTRPSRRPIASLVRQQHPTATLSSASTGSENVRLTNRGPAPELVPGTPRFAHAIELGTASSEWMEASMSPANSFRLSTLLKTPERKTKSGRETFREQENSIVHDEESIDEDDTQESSAYGTESSDVANHEDDDETASASPTYSMDSSFCSSPEDYDIFDLD